MTTPLIDRMAEALRGDLMTFGMMAACISDPQLQADLINEGKRRRDMVREYDSSKEKNNAAR